MTYDKKTKHFKRIIKFSNVHFRRRWRIVCLRLKTTIHHCIKTCRISHLMVFLISDVLSGFDVYTLDFKYSNRQKTHSGVLSWLWLWQELVIATMSSKCSCSTRRHSLHFSVFVLCRRFKYYRYRCNTFHGFVTV